MNVDLDSFESKIEQVLRLCRELRAENRSLRERLAGLDADREALTGKIASARVRLEALMERLPLE